MKLWEVIEAAWDDDRLEARCHNMRLFRHGQVLRIVNVAGVGADWLGVESWSLHDRETGKPCECDYRLDQSLVGKPIEG